jgi:CubicO group peptidase (beta-lactamase class C family)
VLAAIVCCMVTPFVLSAQSIPQPLKTELQSKIKNQIDSGKIEGASHLVGLNGETIYFEVAGYADAPNKASLKPDSIMRIYSMTKPIVSVAAMTLFEKGKFELDDPVSKFIPAFEKMKVVEGEGSDAKLVDPKRPITIRDVFQHTTGYSYGDEAPVEKYYRSEGVHYVGVAAMLPPEMTIEQAADAMARIPTLHQPGQRFTYGFSTDLLGRLIEIWSGQRLDNYLNQAVFTPLEMVDTGFSVPQAKRSRFTSCHSTDQGRLIVIDPAATSPFCAGFAFLSGGGGLVSTMQDYAHFCQMLVDDGKFKDEQILKQDSLWLMMTDQLEGVAGPFKFGLGFAIDKVKLGSGDQQREALQYSWGGYASTDFRVIPSEKLYQIVMRQHVPSSHELRTGAETNVGSFARMK